MTFFVDFTQIPLQRTGVGVYAEHLLAEMVPLLLPNERLLVLVQSDERAVVALLPKSDHRVKVLSIPARLFRSRTALLFFEQFLLPLLLLKHRVGLIHSLHYTHPLIRPCARAVTVHDLTFSLFPELHTGSRRILFPFFTKHAVQKVECPLFVSRATAEDAERLFGATRHTNYVTPLGVDPPHSPGKADELPSTPLRPYLLFLGTIEPRKNLVRVVEAFNLLAGKYPEHLLLIVGKQGWHTEATAAAIERSPYRDRIQLPGFVTEEQKAALLRHCDALLYPSLYEGFGLPVLEAMAHGAPVITSDLSSMPEVAAGAALLVDPHSARAIADAIDRLLKDPELAQALRQAGPLRAAQFTWQRTAETTLAAYRKVKL